MSCIFFHTGYHGHMTLCELDGSFLLYDCGAGKKSNDRIVTQPARKRRLQKALEDCAKVCCGNRLFVFISHGDEDHFNCVWKFLQILESTNKNNQQTSVVFLLLGGKWLHYSSSEHKPKSEDKAALLSNRLISKDDAKYFKHGIGLGLGQAVLDSRVS